MKFAVCSIYDSAYAELGNITIDKNAKEYCYKYGYDLIVRKDNFVLPKHEVGYEKIHLILEVLNTNKYDWIYWRGADTMITNFDIELRDLVSPYEFFIIGSDVHNLNADSFFIRNCQTSINFFTEIFNDRSKYVDEQQAFHMLHQKYNFKVIPQKFINSYDYTLYTSLEPFNKNGYQPECESGLDIFGQLGQWTPGDFLIHWPGITLDKRIELARKLI
jgi:hypothetical protein